MRLIELVLLLAPVAAFVLWRVLAARNARSPSVQTLAALVVVLALLGGGLVWFSLSERSAGDTRYVPARLDGTRIVPGHGA